MAHTENNADQSGNARQPGRPGLAGTSGETGAGTGPTDHPSPPDDPGAPVETDEPGGSGHAGHSPESGSGKHQRQASPRSEVPSTVGLVADAGDFTAMRAYRSFVFDDHRRYLQRMETLLRELAAQGIHVAVGVFRPHEYAEYCEATGQDPDTALARTRYTAEITAGGPTVAYVGQPLDHLVQQLGYEADRQTVWERATDLLAAAADCADCGRELAQEAFGRASQALITLVRTAGPGRHHLVCSVPAAQVPLLAALHTDHDDNGHVHLAENDALVFCTVLAAGIVTDSPGGVVLRSETADGCEQVRGWSLRDGWLQPLSEAEVFNAYCTDAESGEPVPPEPGVEYHAGTPLTQPEE